MTISNCGLWWHWVFFGGAHIYRCSENEVKLLVWNERSDKNKYLQHAFMFPCRSSCGWRHTPSLIKTTGSQLPKSEIHVFTKETDIQKKAKSWVYALPSLCMCFLWGGGLVSRSWMFVSQALGRGLRPDWKTGARWIDPQQWLVVFVYPFAQLSGLWRWESIHHDLGETGGHGHIRMTWWSTHCKVCQESSHTGQ